MFSWLKWLTLLLSCVLFCWPALRVNLKWFWWFTTLRRIVHFNKHFARWKQLSTAIHSKLNEFHKNSQIATEFLPASSPEIFLFFRFAKVSQCSNAALKGRKYFTPNGTSVQHSTKNPSNNERKYVWTETTLMECVAIWPFLWNIY